MTKGSCDGHFLLVYGSQTGQAKAIAEELAETAASQGLKPDLHCLSLTEKKVPPMSFVIAMFWDIIL